MLDNDFDEDFDFLDDENENIEKKKKTNNNENTINDILVLCKNESLKEDQEDFDIFEGERAKCPNRVDKILFHGTSIEPISCILTGYFRKSINSDVLSSAFNNDITIKSL